MSILRDLTFDEVVEQFVAHKQMCQQAKTVKNILIWTVVPTKKR
jgi:hypothetical protein